MFVICNNQFTNDVRFNDGQGCSIERYMLINVINYTNMNYKTEDVNMYGH